jgi:hypothetical protein
MSERDKLIEAMKGSAIIDAPHADVCLRVMAGRIPGLFDVIDGKAVIVPREATAEMLDAMIEASEQTQSIWSLAAARDIYDAALAASPYRSKTDDQ